MRSQELQHTDTELARNLVPETSATGSPSPTNQSGQFIAGTLVAGSTSSEPQAVTLARSADRFNLGPRKHGIGTDSEPSVRQVAGVTALGVQVAAQPFILDKASPLDPTSFPNQPRNGGSYTPATIPNVKHLLDSYGITSRYNTIRKLLSITMPGQSGTSDNADNIAIAQIISLATLNGMPTGQVPSFVASVGDRNQFNPIAGWISSRSWDGIDRLQAFYDTLVECEDYPKPLKQKLIYRWLISAVAAALKPSGFRARGVLTLQGPQSIGKTAWVNGLVPDPLLREVTVKLDHHLDAGNKDSQLTAISHWIVEIGELDSSFKKDVARLKGFLTSDRDKVRRPYARSDSEFARRTVFCATVNEQNFLVDSTGNSRWWTIAVTKIDYEHGIDMQQVFAQLAVDFHNGEPWWLTRDEEVLLETYNKSHRAISAIRERVLASVDLENVSNLKPRTLSAIGVLLAIGIKYPSNSQCKECAAALREALGEPKKIRGYYCWRVTLLHSTGSPIPVANDDNDGKVSDDKVF